ncbi:hypothetical protein [Aneurinibacillus aneurinilyticus]|uniref:hypothetical protein n=1 Tax=Aneurinibacillus aneurinilyticus TaxID=1391 RepID=UPI003670561F
MEINIYSLIPYSYEGTFSLEEVIGEHESLHHGAIINIKNQEYLILTLAIRKDGTIVLECSKS